MEARAIQWTVRQSARKMRLVIDQIRGRSVPEAYGILRFSKKHAAKQIHKVLKSAVANAEQRALRDNVPLDVDGLRVRYAVVNEGPTLKRFTSAAMGRATPIKKRTSHVEIHVSAPDAPAARPAPAAGKGKEKEPKGAAKGAKQQAAPAEAKAPAKSAKGKAAGKRTKTGTKPRRRSD